MKNTFAWVAAAIAAGALGGAALGYWEARPWATSAAAIGVLPDASSDSTAASSQPRAVAPETTFNFGNMELGATQRHTFPIKNEGQRELTVTFVSHTCKCTTVEFNGKPVEPGAELDVPPHASAEVLLEWAAKGAMIGPFRHGAQFTTNDSQLGRFELSVEGDIVDSTFLEPAELNFSSVRVGQVGRAELVVMAFLEPDVQILSHQVFDDELASKVKVTFEPVPKDKLPDPKAKAGIRVVAEFTPGGTLGSIQGGSLRLETNLKQAPRIEVPILGNVKGDISIIHTLWNEETGLLRMPTVKSDQGGSTRLAILIRGDHASETELRVASVTPPELKATLSDRKQIRDGVVSEALNVAIPPGTRPMVRAGDDQGGEGEIVLATAHPTTPELRMRVHFIVQP